MTEPTITKDLTTRLSIEYSADRNEPITLWKASGPKRDQYEYIEIPPAAEAQILAILLKRQGRIATLIAQADTAFQTLEAAQDTVESLADQEQAQESYEAEMELVCQEALQMLRELIGSEGS